MPSMSMLLSSSVCQGLHPLKLKQPQIRRWVLLSCTRKDHATSKKANEEMDSGGGGSGGGGEGERSPIYFFPSPSKSPPMAVDMSWPVAKTSPPPATKRAIHGKKNLAMCTETLGCETGAVYPVGYFDADAENGHTGRPKEEMVAMRRKRGSERTGFPPPLTTLLGGSRLRILSRRENGRLLLQPVKPSVMEAERTDGRLRLRFYCGRPFHSNDKEVGELEYEEAKEEEEEEGGYLGVVGMEMNEMSYSSISGGEEMGIGRFRRPGGCKEEEGGGHGGMASRSKVMLNWEAEAFWVASS
ncbi:protein FANTASTIC FOUR 3-like [Phoenix dactylifera]|uniref:Protein FANTASTIC FOUR 3-like n=1 Tax=Phoenix dactylifera TaxID=42345 RepID=A0A8B8ZK45_PHODC|nr:protein FANTASTIC FOUR 3-like [Phoenix dactylifera]